MTSGRVSGRADHPPARFLVLESGAGAVEAWLHSAVDRGAVVVKGVGNEAPTALFLRVLRRIAIVEREQSYIDRALLVMANVHDAQVMSERRLIARALLTHLSRGNKNAKLIFAVSQATPAHREELLNLLETSIAEPAARRVSILLHFGSAAPDAAASGVRPAVRIEQSETTSSNSRPAPLKSSRDG